MEIISVSPGSLLSWKKIVAFLEKMKIWRGEWIAKDRCQSVLQWTFCNSFFEFLILSKKRRKTPTFRAEIEGVHPDSALWG